jgi:hypothetical protein
MKQRQGAKAKEPKTQIGNWQLKIENVFEDHVEPGSPAWQPGWGGGGLLCVGYVVAQRVCALASS